MYYRTLSDLDVDSFIEACDRIIFLDEWFPQVARIREVARTCQQERQRTETALATITSIYSTDLVCPTCHGNRYVRYGGYDPVNMLAGDGGSRTQPCPTCTFDGTYDPALEQRAIARYGGVTNPSPVSQQEWVPGPDTWRLPRTADGRPDMDALYRMSRIMRKLDPDVDERPRQVGGWKTLGSMVAETLAGSDGND